MAELNRAVFTLLEQAADGAVDDPPLDRLIRLGADRRSRRRILMSGGAAVATAAVVVTAVLVAPGGGGAVQARRSPPPTSAAIPPSPRALTGPTAQQLAQGRWAPIAPAPFAVCDDTVAAWGDGALLVVSPFCDSRGVSRTASAALYDPRSDHWQSLGELHGFAAPLWTAVVADRYVVVSGSTGRAAALPTRSTDAVTGWLELPDLPETVVSTYGSGFTVRGGTVVVGGTGKHGDGVWALRDGRWGALPRLPRRSAETITSVGLGTLGSDLFAVDTALTVHAQTGNSGRSADATPHLVRLDGSAWTELPTALPLPYVATAITGFGGELLTSGSRCPPFTPCPMTPTEVLLFAPGSGSSDIDAQTPLAPADTQFVPAGRAIVGIDLHTRISGGGRSVDPGDTIVWDASHRRWIRGPSARTADVSVTTWTPYGLVVLGVAERGSRANAGQILRPKS